MNFFTHYTPIYNHYLFKKLIKIKQLLLYFQLYNIIYGKTFKSFIKTLLVIIHKVLQKE